MPIHIARRIAPSSTSLESQAREKVLTDGVAMQQCENDCGVH
eukprot:COSAG02_NODE_4147_length_5715_cov_4.516204_2_plen_42_part_00